MRGPDEAKWIQYVQEMLDKLSRGLNSSFCQFYRIIIVSALPMHIHTIVIAVLLSPIAIAHTLKPPFSGRLTFYFHCLSLYNFLVTNSDLLVVQSELISDCDRGCVPKNSNHLLLQRKAQRSLYGWLKSYGNSRATRTAPFVHTTIPVNQLYDFESSLY